MDTISKSTKYKIKDTFLFFYPFICLLGMIGNMVSFIVFSRKKFKNTLFSIYFRFIIITDSFTLIFTIIDYLKYKHNIDIELKGEAFCKLTLYLIYAVAPLNGWVLVVVAFDRLINIKNSSSCLKLRKNKPTQLKICILFLVFNLVYYTPMIKFKKYRMSSSYDEIKNETIINYECILDDSNGLIYIIDFFHSTIFPFFFMILFTCLTLFYLFKSRTKIKSNKNSIKSKDLKFALTSISLNLCFLFLNFPIVLFLLLSNYFELISSNLDLFYVIGSTFYYMNYGNVFYINILVNSLFKNELVQMIKSKSLLNSFSFTDNELGRLESIKLTNKKINDASVTI